MSGNLNQPNKQVKNSSHPGGSNQRLNIPLVMTGFFVAVSYVLLLTPLALFGIAQTYALHGKKTSLILSVVVLLILFCLAVSFGLYPLFIRALIALCTIPLFFIACILREKRISIFWSAALLLIPIGIFLGSLVLSPVLTPQQYNESITRIEQQFAQEKQNKLSAAANHPDSVKNLTNLENIYSSLTNNLEEMRNLKQVKEFLSYSPSQKLVYFVFDEGAAFLFTMIISFLGCLILLDFAFEQIEKLKAILNYTALNQLDKDFIFALRSLSGQNLIDSTSTGLHIVKHAMVSNTGNDEKSLFFGLIKKTRPKNLISLKNYLFYFEGKTQSWGLSKFQMPLPFVMLPLIFIVGLIFYFGNVPNLITAFGHMGSKGALLSTLSLASIFILSVLVLQGLFTVLVRSSLVLLIVIGCASSILSSQLNYAFGPYFFLVFFGIIGLLDYVYDWRGRKS